MTIPQRTLCFAACVLAVAFLPLWAESAAAVQAWAHAAPGGASANIGAGAAKPAAQFVACLFVVLGIGGVLLAFASGAFAPVLAVLIAGAAMEVCG